MAMAGQSRGITRGDLGPMGPVPFVDTETHGDLRRIRKGPGLYDCLMSPLKQNLFDLLRSLGLPMGDYAIFGSGPLIMRGIIEATNDLDVISRGRAWERALRVGEQVSLPNWAYGDFNIDRLIDTAEVIDGLPFVRLEHVVHYKKIAARPKDVIHLELLAEYQRDHPLTDA